ncbi:MAG: diguanylate cyclase, partial [Sciscionella sp.]
FEIAEEIMARAAGHAEQIGSEHLRVVLLINQVDLHIDWGRRLERVNYAARAQQHYDRAALIAALTEQRYPSSMFARDGGGSPADQDPALAVARAYTEPGRAHYQRLRAHLQTGQPSSTIASVALGLARCHEHEGDYAEAVRLLSTVAQRHGADRAEPLVWTSLHRELARLTQLEQGSAPPSEVLDYLDQLEGELWDMRAGRISILRTRREHHRLTMAHGTIAAQALQDPLTELPNRRALDERFTEIVDNPAQFPISVALLDLDGFKLVNDRISHAKGDEVLRIIAGALRSALRTDDLIARYGGDEFVVLLAGASLAAAKAAMHRSVAAVAALPQQAAMGVTISVGVIAMHQQESPESALARADAAMYEAKRRGGNSVIGQEGS